MFINRWECLFGWWADDAELKGRKRPEKVRGERERERERERKITNVLIARGMEYICPSPSAIKWES